jgi:apolipoprotein N-acyltransferase
VSLLTGALEGREDRIYNTAWLFNENGTLCGTYRKRDLVMFGEYVPWRNKLPFLKRYPIRDFDFSPGQERNLLRIEGVPFGVLICFEAIFPGPAREEVLDGAEFLVFMTSDAWAGRSSEVLLHSYTAPLRAVETGRWVVRAASTGRSAIISPQGKLLGSVGVFRSGSAHALITPLRHLTCYVRHGDTPLLMLAAVLVVLGLAGRQRRSRADREREAMHKSLRRHICGLHFYVSTPALAVRRGQARTRTMAKVQRRPRNPL